MSGSFRISLLEHRTASRLLMAVVAIFLLTLLIDSALIFHFGADTPTNGDGPYYIGLARSMASNNGYYLEESFWPNIPNVARSPLWPAVLSIPARLMPSANDNAILKFTGAVMHGIAAMLLILLAFQVTGSIAAAVLSGFLLGLYPPAAGLVVGGFSEMVFLVFAIAGLVLIFEGGWWRYVGALLSGVSVLARSNYVLMPIMLVMLLVLLRPKALVANWRPLILGCAAFALFPALWIVRNYAVSGYFPVLSAMEGETLYGGNNARVAEDLSVWGYWVMPDQIPGETTKRNLSATRSELELNKYYHDRAIEFIRTHKSSMPRLILGKLIRGFVPIPWVPLAASYIAFGFRALVYAGFLAALLYRRKFDPQYTLFVVAMFVITLLTTVIYYGTFRFTFCVEPFLFPFLMAALVHAGRRRTADFETARAVRSQLS